MGEPRVFLRQLWLAIAIAAIAAVAACKKTSGENPDAGDDDVGLCGNLVVDPSEVCDDGNQTDGDGCSADCSSDESCGNLEMDVATGEVCDDGNNLSGDGCRADCKSDESCGNQIVDIALGETCDDGNGVSGDGCNNLCQSNESCGNMITDVGEECDTGGFSMTCD